MKEIRPSRSNNKASTLTLILLIAAVAVFAICVAFKSIPFRWGFQLAAIGLFTAGVYIVARYLTKFYSYRIDGDELTVTELSGKRQLTVCRISLSSVKKISLVDFPEGKNITLPDEIKKERKKRFDYRVDLSPNRFILIETDEGYENSAIYLSYDETLWRLLGAEH